MTDPNLLRNALQPIAEEGRKRLAAIAQITALVPYDIGMLLHKLKQDDANANIEADLAALCASWQVSDEVKNKLRAAVRVCPKLDRNFLKDQAAIPLSDGTYLTFEHFVVLESVPEPAARLLLKKVREHNWSAKKMAEELTRQENAEVTLPKAPEKALAKLQTLLMSVNDYARQVQAVATGAWTAVNLSAPVAGLRERTEAVLSEATKTSAALEVLTDRLSQFYQRISSKSVAAKSEPQPAIAAKRRADDDDLSDEEFDEDLADEDLADEDLDEDLATEEAAEALSEEDLDEGDMSDDESDVTPVVAEHTYQRGLPVSRSRATKEVSEFSENDSSDELADEPPAMPPPKKRGRPAKIETVKPAILTEGQAPVQKRRGRPPGSKNKPKA